MVDHPIKGKTVLVISGAKNLGGLIARDLTAHDTETIAIHYNSVANRTDVDATVAALWTAGAKVVALQGDLTSAATMKKLFTDTIVTVGRPDIAINTVGKVLKKSFTEISEAEYDEMSTINAKSVFFFLREAGKRVNDSGKIYTLVTSLLGVYTPYYAAYADTRVPVEYSTRAAPKEFSTHGISVTTIGPGPMDTPFSYLTEGTDAVTCYKTAAVLSSFSRTGLIDIKDVVSFIHHLVSKGWWITGQTILINGGYTAK